MKGVFAAVCVTGVGILGVISPATANANVDENVAVVATCATLSQMPTMSGVVGSVQGMQGEGFTPAQIGRVLGIAAFVECTQHQALIKRYVDLAAAA